MKWWGRCESGGEGGGGGGGILCHLMAALPGSSAEAPPAHVHLLLPSFLEPPTYLAARPSLAHHPPSHTRTHPPARPPAYHPPAHPLTCAPAHHPPTHPPARPPPRPRSEFEVDFVTLSYARSPEDVAECREFLESIGREGIKVGQGGARRGGAGPRGAGRGGAGRGGAGRTGGVEGCWLAGWGGRQERRAAAWRHNPRKGPCFCAPLTFFSLTARRPSTCRA